MTEFSSCVKCGYQTTDLATFCPQCRGRMLSSVKIRRLGWLSALIGIFQILIQTRFRENRVEFLSALRFGRLARLG
jgi:hypothetical protein